MGESEGGKGINKRVQQSRIQEAGRHRMYIINHQLETISSHIGIAHKEKFFCSNGFIEGLITYCVKGDN